MTPLTAPLRTTAAAQADAPGTSAGGITSAADQQDRFMRLLVAQMRNQDPLNPMDNAQMTSQIAQINTVAGLEKLNKTVEGLMGGMSALQGQSALQLPGRSVLVAGERQAHTGGETAIGVELGARADQVNLDLLAEDGRLVRSLTLGPTAAGMHTLRWDGLQADGAAAPAGSYRLRVTATAGGQPVQASPLVAARVQSAAATPSGLQVDLGDAGVRGWGDLKAFL